MARPTDEKPKLSKRRTSRRCGVRIKGGGYCSNPAGSQTDHPGIGPCARHGGNSPTGLKQVGMRLAHQGIMDPDVGPGDIVQIEPHNALIWAIWLSAGDVGYWNSRLGELNLDVQSLIDDEADPDEIKAAQRELKDAFQQQRTAIREMRASGKMALDAGIAERQVALAERMAAILVEAIQQVTGELELSPTQEAMLPTAVKKALLQLEAPGGQSMPRPKAALRNFKKGDVVYEASDD